MMAFGRNLFSASDIRSASDKTFIRRSRVDKILKWVRSCPACKTIRGPIDLLCRSCETQLWQMANSGEVLRQEGYPFPVYSLWTWHKDEIQEASSLVFAFKGGLAVEFSRRLIERIVFERLRTGPLYKKPYFVYPYSSAGEPFTHAWLLAHCLQQSFIGSRLLALAPVEKKTTHQKQKRLEDRMRLRFHPVAEEREKITRVEAGEVTWVFVDDVITSGATAMAAYMALGEPENYEVWTIACRPKLAGKSAF